MPVPTFCIFLIYLLHQLQASTNNPPMKMSTLLTLLYKLQLLGLNEKLMRRVVSNIYDLFNLAFDGIFLAEDDDDTFDVVADHQQHNRKPKPPSADCLHSSAAHHRSWPRQVVESDENEIIPNTETKTADAPVDEDTKSDVSEPVKKHAKCNSTYCDAKPSQLHFYNGAWVDILLFYLSTFIVLVGYALSCTLHPILNSIRGDPRSLIDIDPCL